MANKVKSGIQASSNKLMTLPLMGTGKTQGHSAASGAATGSIQVIRGRVRNPIYALCCRKVIAKRMLSRFGVRQMNTGLLFSGIAALVLGLLFEVLIRVSKSKTWWRARVFIVLGTLLVVVSIS